MIQGSSNRNSRGERKAVPLATGLDKRLLGYAAAASAAGVGLLATAQPAQAKIIYKHMKIAIPVDAGGIKFDLNNDGTPDFGFYNSYTIGGIRHELGTHGGGVQVGPLQPNNGIVEVTSNKQACAAALKAGVRVGPRQNFATKYVAMAASGGNYTNGGSAYGPWLRVNHGYLGFKFSIQGTVHYGWARVEWHGIGQVEYITGYAYESIANKSILTGKKKGASDSRSSTTLGSLARGAAAR